MKNVITYQLAYLTTQLIDLCLDCLDRRDLDLPALGPVQHGLHRGTCEACDGAYRADAKGVRCKACDHRKSKGFDGQCPACAYERARKARR